MTHRFRTGERLKSRKEIGRLFAPGSRTQSAYPIRIVYRQAEERRGPFPVQAAFVVPKRKFKRATDRNRIKRRMREAYRLHKHALAGTLVRSEDPERQIALLCIYTGKEAMPFRYVERKMKQLLERVAREYVVPG